MFSQFFCPQTEFLHNFVQKFSQFQLMKPEKVWKKIFLNFIFKFFLDEPNMPEMGGNDLRKQCWEGINPENAEEDDDSPFAIKKLIASENPEDYLKNACVAIFEAAEDMEKPTDGDDCWDRFLAPVFAERDIVCIFMRNFANEFRNHFLTVKNGQNPDLK